MSVVIRHLTVDEVAAELGRSTYWVYRNWRDLVAKRRMPRPVSGADGGGTLAWSAAHFYAWLDRDLPPELKAAATAYRAAAAAYVVSHIDDDEQRAAAASRARLDQRFAR